MQSGLLWFDNDPARSISASRPGIWRIGMCRLPGMRTCRHSCSSLQSSIIGCFPFRCSAIRSAGTISGMVISAGSRAGGEAGGGVEAGGGGEAGVELLPSERLIASSNFIWQEPFRRC